MLLDIWTTLGVWGSLLLILVIAIVIFVFALKIGVQSVKGKNTEMGAVFVTGLLNAVLLVVLPFIFSYVGYPLIGLIVYIIVALLLIKSRHETTFFGALGAWIIALIVLILIFWLLSFLLVGLWAAFIAIFSP
jgi:hypothetical protein